MDVFCSSACISDLNLTAADDQVWSALQNVRYPGPVCDAISSYAPVMRCVS